MRRRRGSGGGGEVYRMGAAFGTPEKGVRGRRRGGGPGGVMVGAFAPARGPGMYHNENMLPFPMNPENYGFGPGLGASVARSRGHRSRSHRTGGHRPGSRQSGANGRR